MRHTKTPFTDKELLQLRQAGRRPRIGIVADDFIVDWESKALVMESDPTKRIDLDNLPLSEDAKSYLCFYNHVTKSVVVIPENITRVPKDTVLLVIPTEAFLDPVAVARSFGQLDTFLLDTYPIRARHEAKVIPMEASGLPELVARNIEKRKSRSVLRFFRRSKNKGIR